MQKRLLSVVIFSLLFSKLVFAADQAAKEEITPPQMEGAFTVEQIQPINSIPLANSTIPAKPPAPVATPPQPGSDSTSLIPHS